MEFIRQDWKRPLLVKKEKENRVEFSFSQNYMIWRIEKLFGIIKFTIARSLESKVEQPKRKKGLIKVQN
jgi:hypothetical protein